MGSHLLFCYLLDEHSAAYAGFIFMGVRDFIRQEGAGIGKTKGGDSNGKT